MLECRLLIRYVDRWIKRYINKYVYIYVHTNMHTFCFYLEFQRTLNFTFTQLQENPQKRLAIFWGDGAAEVCQCQKYKLFFFKLKNQHTGQDQEYIIVPKNKQLCDLGHVPHPIICEIDLYMCFLHCDQTMHIKLSTQCLAIDEHVILFFKTINIIVCY